MLSGIGVYSYTGKLTKEHILSLDSSNIDEAYKAFIMDDVFGIEEEFRQGQVETGIDPWVGSHYEAIGVATKMYDGTWVGWNYYTGGGKHGNAEEIEWINDAYFLNVIEREEIVIVRTFEKK